jgi:hypothetical protein
MELPPPATAAIGDTPSNPPPDPSPDSSAATDFMILADGTIYARNLTPDLARILAALNPHDATMAARAASAHS